jgi:hypothetical protein
MKAKELIKAIKGTFLLPEKTYYFGKIVHGTPYFEPTYFIPSIIRVRKLKLRTQEEIAAYNEKYPHFRHKREDRFSNMPMVRRSKNKIFKFLGGYYYITWGWPISVTTNDLGWKDKYETPRYEWSPALYVHFFGLQFCIWWNAPKLEGEKYPDNDNYYEMILWYLHYADKDIKKAEETWGWTNYDTKESTWDKRYLVK